MDIYGTFASTGWIFRNCPEMTVDTDFIAWIGLTEHSSAEETLLECRNIIRWKLETSATSVYIDKVSRDCTNTFNREITTNAFDLPRVWLDLLFEITLVTRNSCGST